MHRSSCAFVFSIFALAACSGGAASDETSTSGALTAPVTGAHVLVVVSAAAEVATTKGGTTPAGVYLAEVAEPVRRMLKDGVAVAFVSPGGKTPTIDPVSDAPRWFDGRDDYEDAKAVLHRSGFESPAPLESLSDDDIRSYDAVFFPGGHAPITDLRDHPAVARILRIQHEAHKLTGAICHGSSALLAARDGARSIYEGYRLTGYSNEEEKLGVALDYIGAMPAFSLEDALRNAGAEYRQGIPFLAHTERDRELVTGENPQSSKRFTEAFVGALAEQISRDAPSPNP